MEFTKLPLSAIAVALAANMAVSAPASAANEKILPGAICTPTSVGISAQRTFYTGGSIVNWTQAADGSFQDARLHCPLVRDNQVDKWNRIYVRVTDRSNVRGVDCSATVYDYYGNPVSTVTKSSGAGFMGNTSLRFDAPSSSHGYTPFSVSCTVPTNTHPGVFGAVHGLRLIENGS